MPFEDQVGLLIHESLRHLQITHGLHFSDKDLQQLTQAIVQSGDEPVHLDSARFLNGKIQEIYYRVLDLEIEQILSRQSGATAPFSSLSQKEQELAILKRARFYYLDKIIQDYQSKGWTPHKSDAAMILQLLEEQKNIRLPETVH